MLERRTQPRRTLQSAANLRGQRGCSYRATQRAIPNHAVDSVLHDAWRMLPEISGQSNLCRLTALGIAAVRASIHHGQHVNGYMSPARKLRLPGIIIPIAAIRPCSAFDSGPRGSNDRSHTSPRHFCVSCLRDLYSTESPPACRDNFKAELRDAVRQSTGLDVRSQGYCFSQSQVHVR